MGVPDTAVIIPVFNESSKIGEVIDKVHQEFPFVICVDDGSKDNSSTEITKHPAVLVAHPFNLGQGAALQTGLEYALQFPNVRYFITFDADGQHSIKDAQKMLDVLRKEKLDVVLGSRFLGGVVNLSRTRKLLLKLAVKFTNLISGVNLTDTHNGLRIFNRDFAESVDITMGGMAHASEIVDKLGRGNWKYKEVPVTIQYTDYSQSKGQSLFNSVNILTDVLLSRARRI